jgi:hypothetical protein
MTTAYASAASSESLFSFGKPSIRTVRKPEVTKVSARSVASGKVVCDGSQLHSQKSIIAKGEGTQA